MKRTVIVIALGLIVFAGFYFLVQNSTPEETTQVEVQTAQNDMQLYSNSDLGFAFEYKAGANGYIVTESTSPDEKVGEVHAIVLTRAADASQSAPIGGEGPATISFMVFLNTQNEFPLQFAQKNEQYSNINLKTSEVEETVVGGANAIRYTADGLYPSDTLVVANGDHMYIVSGMYTDPNSQLKLDFNPIVDSITFIPTPKQAQSEAQGKLDIHAVCEDALAYMTFESSEAADAFVEACVEGKHPEVIEQFRERMGIENSAAI